MMLICHKTPGFTGDVVIATRVLSFEKGIAEVDLTLAQAAAVKVKGHTVKANYADGGVVKADAVTKPAKIGYGELTEDVEVEQKPAEMYDYLPGDDPA